MGGKPKGGGKVSKTNVTAREKTTPQRALALVFESYRKPNGAIGLRKHWEEA